MAHPVCTPEQQAPAISARWHARLGTSVNQGRAKATEQLPAHWCASCGHRGSPGGLPGERPQGEQAIGRPDGGRSRRGVLFGICQDVVMTAPGRYVGCVEGW
eukprot:9471977-Pyramimonas_sp.AAC.3